MTSRTPWHSASEGTIFAANAAMREIADSDLDACTKVARIEAIWRPVAQALVESIRPDLPTASPAAWEIAKGVGPDFIGMTSDTGRVVSWGAATIWYRPFVIHASAD